MVSGRKSAFCSVILVTTAYHSSATQLPAGMKAATVDGVGSGTLTINWRYDGDDNEKNVIPGGTAVMLKSSAGEHTLTLLPANTDAAPAGNLLKGSDVATTTYGADKYYKLSYGHSDTEYQDILGWYWGAAEGAAFSIGAHKAWLALTDAQAGLARYFSLDDEATGVQEVLNARTEESKSYYDLQGRRVTQPNKGLYIVNGKKVVIK